VTGILCTLGAAAFAHPITIAAGFFTAPVTTLSPVIGAGHVLALVQAWVQPPVVAEFERLAEDFVSPLRWWRNRLLRVLLVHPDDARDHVGMYVGGWEIVRSRSGAAMSWRIALLCAAGALAACRIERPAFPEGRLVDLTHAFDADTIYWPTEEGFVLERGSEGRSQAGYWYAAHRMRLAEHGGTHIEHRATSTGGATDRAAHA
jgi:hypothetical protein